MFSERLYTADKQVPVDEKGRIRIDELELSPDVQDQVAELWPKATTDSLPAIGDLDGYKMDFFISSDLKYTM